jgi:hypothetical protein
MKAGAVEAEVVPQAQPSFRSLAPRRPHGKSRSGVIRIQLLGVGVQRSLLRLTERVEILKTVGHPLLDQAAIAAFQRWRFRAWFSAYRLSTVTPHVTNSLADRWSKPATGMKLYR